VHISFDKSFQTHSAYLTDSRPYGTIVRSKPGKNCPLFLSRFSQWIHVPQTTLFEKLSWATSDFPSNPRWRPKI